MFTTTLARTARLSIFRQRWATQSRQKAEVNKKYRRAMAEKDAVDTIAQEPRWWRFKTLQKQIEEGTVSSSIDFLNSVLNEIRTRFDVVPRSQVMEFHSYLNDKKIQKNSKTYSLLIQLFLKLDDKETVTKIIEEIEDSNNTCEKDMVLCASMISAYSKLKKKDSICAILDELQEQKKMTAQFYRFAFREFIALNEHDTIIHYWYKMVESGLICDEIYGEILLKHFINLVSHYEFCEVLFQFLKEHKKATKKAYSVVMLVHARQKNFVKMVDLYNEMLAEGFVPDQYVFACLLLICILYSSVSKEIVDGIRRNIDQSAVSMDVVLPQIFRELKIYHNFSDERIFESFMKLVDTGITVGERSVYTLLFMYAREDKIHYMHKLLDAMKKLKIATNVYAFNPLIQYYAANKQYVEMELMFKRLVENTQPNVATFNSMIKAYCSGRRPDDLRRLFQRMMMERVQIQSGAIESVFRFYEAEHLVEDLSYFHKLLKKQNIPLTVKSYATLINIYYKWEMYDQVKEVHNEMVTFGLFQPNDFINTIMDDVAKKSQNIQ